MRLLHVTEPDEDGMVAVITDAPCPCGWPETILHVYPDGTAMRGCASCEREVVEP